MSHKRILVTGGAGFIGSNFIRYIVENHPNMFTLNIDVLTYAGSMATVNTLPVSNDLLFERVDIRDEQRVKTLLVEHDIDTIIHFAAESHVDRSIDAPTAFVETNVNGTLALLQAARSVFSTGKKIHFHHISTDEVFGSLNLDEPAFTETTPYAPNSPYAASKAASDHLARAFYHTYGLPLTLTNCSNNYGPFQYPEKLIPLMVLNALRAKPLPIYGDGKQIRDWLYVEDHCEAIWTVVQQGVIGESYNIGGDNQPTNIEIARSICAILDELKPDPEGPYERLITFVTDRPGHDRRYAMNSEKIQQRLGWRPKHDLRNGLRATVAWYLENTNWLRALEVEKGLNSDSHPTYSHRGEK